MPIRSPSLVELHAFLAVARTGSFRQAAEHLCVTQAAVSRAVLRLEAHLGQDVFTRSGAGVQLTPAGVELRRRVERPVAALEDAAQALLRPAERLRLRLSVVPSIGNLWLLPRLPAFRAQRPDVELELRQYRHDEDYLRDDVDAWIALKHGPAKRWPRQLAARYLVGQEIVAVCAPARAQGIATARQLLSQQLLYHSNYPDNWSLWAQAVGATLPARWKGTGFDLVMNLIDAARSGMGVAVVQQCMVEADLAAGRLVMPVPGVALTGRGYYLCTRRSLGPHPAAEAFSAWVLAQARATQLSAPASRAAHPARG